MKSYLASFALIDAAILGFSLHEIFHFSDWVVWGLHSFLLDAPRQVLYPLYGARDIGGFVAHAITNGLVLVALIYARFRDRARIKR